MASLVPMQNTLNPPMRYVNSAPSSAITNTTTETAFDQIFTFPSMPNRYVQPTTLIRMKAWGVVSTSLLNLGLTLRVRWGGVSGVLLASTGLITLASSLSQQAWNAEMTCAIQSIGASGSMEAQGFLNVTAGLLSISAASMSNVSPVSISTVSSNDIVMTAQWSVSDPSDSIQARIIHVLVDGP